ncbi:hypothetical protein THASP1DRAFT_27959 [Thamnocephalis sphaerospora]|uniref:G-protein coupled receptors family 2 profile 2 domain-containing protein n=1 Tax=Thamnocephalis sphaerospora TaxID=78915 RepID=A0A4P9XVG8_9FUNG|nr:hypothetical protein THASP1DRAFT_27959 [Thamnocephalis sphaerospora]|eukprot:RKP10275.1 hypothetical protein THASP1DRAFT_27959 [Thamnocephalis sphaerospora]
MSIWNDVECENLLSSDWKKDATYQWGIPLHPLGELNSPEYILQAQGNLEEMRSRHGNLSMQSMCNVFFFFIFLRNLYLAARITYQRRRMLASWCCILQAAAGLASALSGTTDYLPHGTPCRVTLWVNGVGVAVSALCVGSTLLQKAYLAHQRNKWLLGIGIILLVPQPVFTYMVWTSPGIMTPAGGCLSCYPSYLPWIKLAMDLPINLVFSTAFLTVVYRQYRMYGSKAWARLVRNGIQTMCLVVLSNLICMFGVAFKVVGVYSQFFFIVDWVITSLLLVHHCVTMCTMVDESSVSDPHSFLHSSLPADTTYAEIQLTRQGNGNNRRLFRR